MARISSSSTKPEPFALTVTPIDVSLTDGTDIPPPPRTPSKEPPTPGGGPLTSHPTTPEKIPGAYPSSSPSSNNDSERDTPEKEQIDMDPRTLRPATDESSPPPPPPQQQQQQILRKPSGVRRLFSMSNLRTSFSGSRTSLALPRASTDYRPSTSMNDRPFTPSMSSTNSGSPPVPPKQAYQPSLQRKRSGGGWFKRKSSLLWMNGDGVLGAVDEDREIDDAGRGAKRFKSAYAMPLLPEISELGGGELGFDASLFGRV